MKLDINVNVTLAVTQRLEALLTSLMSGKESPAVMRTAVLRTAVVRPARGFENAASRPIPVEEVEATTEVPNTSAQDAAPEPMPMDEPDAEPETPKMSDKDRIIKVINDTRVRLLGEDYETNKEVAKLNKQITQEAKSIALSLASSYGKAEELAETDKKGQKTVRPTRLAEINGAPDAFKRELDLLVIEDGQVIQKSTF